MRPEDRLQARVRMFLDAHLPPPATWTAVNKGVLLAGDDQQRMRTAQRLKAQGVKNGIEDVMIWHGRQYFAVELKTEKGRQSEAQQKRQADVEANGQHYQVLRSVIDLYYYLMGWAVPFAPSARIAALHHDAALSVPHVVGKPAKPRTAKARPSARALAFARAAQSPK